METPVKPRANDRVLVMSWPILDAKVRVELLTTKAPTICDLIWEALPFETIQGHALITGQMLFATSPVSTLTRENVTTFLKMGIGGCFYANASQNVGVIYGDVTEPEGHSIWGRVFEEDWPVMRRVGAQIWQNLLAPFGDLRTNPLAKRAIVLECRRMSG